MNIFLGISSNSPTKFIKSFWSAWHENPQQKILAEKLKDIYGVDTIIPAFGEVYELEELTRVVDMVKPVNANKFERLELLDRIETLKEEIDDMILYIKEDLKKQQNDYLIDIYNDKIIELEKKIVEIVKI